MVSHDSPTLTFFIISALVINIVNARSWDLAVTIGREVDFFSNNGTMTGRVKNREVATLSSIAYDEKLHIIYLSNNNNDKNISIFTKNLLSKNAEMDPLMIDTNGSHVMGMIYDHPTQSLFWTDSKKGAILKINIQYRGVKSMKAEVFLNLTNEIPQGITLDVCNRRLYWVNSNTSNSNIQSVNLDATNRTTVVNKNLYEPVAITIDHSTGRLYWVDDEEGIHFKIEYSNLDGTNREILIRGKHQQPVNIAVDQDFVYWTDLVYSAIWRMKKEAKSSDSAQIWKSFPVEPRSLVTRDNLGFINCVAMSAIQKRKNELLNAADNDRYDVLITSTEEDEYSSRQSLNSKKCLNGGRVNEQSNNCLCKQGFVGDICEQSLCFNYCLNNGECMVNTTGQAHCKCNSQYVGPRCEERLCSGYCLNGGECRVKNNVPFCICKYSRGNRCEDLSDVTEICTIYCASRFHISSNGTDNFCKCSGKNFVAQEYKIFNESWSKIVTIISAVIIGVLIIIITVLSYFVNKFRRRPRVKKRFLVSKTGITPLTSRPPLPSDQCEIMIENCCNMNICETPCFEPRLRNTESATRKKEEKNSLLDNMEGNNAC